MRSHYVRTGRHLFVVAVDDHGEAFIVTARDMTPGEKRPSDGRHRDKMTPAQITPKTSTETLPRPAGELNDLASYYDTHDTSTEMEHGQWVDPRPMKTTSLRLPADVVEALKARAHQRSIRYTALLREIIGSAVHNKQAATNKDLAQINDRLARIEAAITGQPAQTLHAQHAEDGA